MMTLTLNRPANANAPKRVLRHLALALTVAGATLLAAQPQAMAASSDSIVVLDPNNPMSTDHMGTLLFGETPPRQDNLIREDHHGRIPLKRTRGIRMTSAAVAPAAMTASAPAAAAAAPAAQAAQGGVSIALPVNFAFNSSELTADARRVLDQIGTLMNKPEYQSKRLVIEGHADAVGSADYNKKLSLLRAVSAGKYLASTHGISPKRMAIDAKGQAEPLPNMDPTHAKNRRVQFRAL